MSRPPKQNVVLLTNVREFVGPAVVPALLADGAKIYCHDRSFDTEVGRMAFAGEQHESVVVLAETEPEALVAAVLAMEGRIDAVISNDVHPATRTPVEAVTPYDFRETLEELLVFPMRLAGAAAAAMKRQKGGRMILVTSAVAAKGLPNYATYAAARGGANALALSLAKELGPYGVSVNAVAPNFVENPTYFPPETLKDPKVKAKIEKSVPLRRAGTPEETGALIAFLAGPSCGFLTGQVLPLTGGWD